MILESSGSRFILAFALDGNPLHEVCHLLLPSVLQRSLDSCHLNLVLGNVDQPFALNVEYEQNDMTIGPLRYSRSACNAFLWKWFRLTGSPANRISAEASNRPCVRFGCSLLAVSVKARGRKRINQPPGSLCDLVNGSVERFLVRDGRLGESADLPDVLKRCVSYFILISRRFIVE